MAFTVHIIIVIGKPMTTITEFNHCLLTFRRSQASRTNPPIRNSVKLVALHDRKLQIVTFTEHALVSNHCLHLTSWVVNAHKPEQGAPEGAPCVGL